MDFPTGTSRTLGWSVSLGLAAVCIFLAGMITEAYWRPLKGTLVSGAETKSQFDVGLGTSLPAWMSEVRRHADDKALGDPDAPVTVTEYTDFQCPYCARHSGRAFRDVVREYVLDGRVYYRVRHFPLSRAHPMAIPAANASECAGDQGKFWPFKAIVMQNQQKLSDRMLLSVGKEIGVEDFQRYKRCVRQNRRMPVLKREFQDARQQNVRATPTIVVGDTTFRGAVPYPKIRRAIERQLSARG